MPLAHRPGGQDLNKNPRSGHRLKSYRLTIQACMTFVMTRVWTVNQKCRCNTLTTVDTGKGELTNKNPSIKPSIKAMKNDENNQLIQNDPYPSWMMKYVFVAESVL